MAQECCGKESAALLPNKTSQADKENIDPCIGKPQFAPASSAPGVFGIPNKQQFARAPSSSAAKGRTPLADITALCMLQVCTNSLSRLLAETDTYMHCHCCLPAMR